MPHKRNKLITQNNTTTLAKPTFGQTIKEGIAFGVGQSVAHRAIGAIFGSPATQEKSVTIIAAEKPEYTQCMKETFQDKEACKQYL
jgi:hypothetical protein